LIGRQLISAVVMGNRLGAVKFDGERPVTSWPGNKIERKRLVTYIPFKSTHPVTQNLNETPSLTLSQSYNTRLGKNPLTQGSFGRHLKYKCCIG
jgi:hypothetical protein